MAFITTGTSPNTNVIAFAEYSDVTTADERLFQANEGLTELIVEDATIRSTERILSLLRATDWWKSYYVNRSADSYNTSADIPELNPNKIQGRKNDFTDLCVYYTLYNYLLPKIADFSTEDNAERAKIGFNQQKFDLLFAELIRAGDWYDFDASGTVASNEKQPGQYNLKRVR